MVECTRMRSGTGLNPTPNALPLTAGVNAVPDGVAAPVVRFSV